MSTDVATWNDGIDDGLEDLDPSDLRVPRLTMTHGAHETPGHFRDGLSGSIYPAIDAVVLGLVKNRVMWKPSVDDNDSPLCKSTDYHLGFPTIGKSNPNDNFPWAAAGWQPSDFQADENGRIKLPCDSCRLKEWKSHPDGKKTWCAEQYHLIIMYGPVDEEPNTLAIFTCQRSSLAPANNFLANFKRLNMPAYSSSVRIGLVAQKRGQNTYYVPTFQTLGKTDQDRWPTYSEAYRDIRDFLRREPALRDASGNIIDTSTIDTSNTVTPAAPVTYTAPTQPVQPVVPVQPVQAQVIQPVIVPTGTTARDADDDDLPF